MARSSVLLVGMPHQGDWVMPMPLAHLVVHSLERLDRCAHGIESVRHRLTGQIDQQVTNEGEELDQMSVAVDDRMVEPGPDAPKWASSGLTDIHHQGHSPGKDVQNGDHGEEEAPSPSVVHSGVQG